MKRVAITGVGAVTPLGLDAKETWRAACAGESGIGWISTFDTDGLPVRVAGEVKGFDPTGVVSACATGSHAVGEAAEMIKRGAADAVLAGGTEACIVPLILAGFTAMRGLAAEDEHPPHASRPFDATRAGFVMSEGAGALLLEDWEQAEARGAEIYAEVLGYGASNDAHHMAQPEPEATGVAAMMRGSLDRAGVDPERVGYINAH